jgi:hypothetical protein
MLSAAGFRSSGREPDRDFDHASTQFAMLARALKCVSRLRARQHPHWSVYMDQAQIQLQEFEEI